MKTAKQDVLEVTSAGLGVTVAELASKTGRPAPSLRRTCNALVKAGMLDKADDGRYVPPERPERKVADIPQTGSMTVDDGADTKRVPYEVLDTGEVSVGFDNGVPYRGRTKPCPKCGQVGVHTCCSKCDTSANGVDDVGEHFGWLKAKNKTLGVYLRSQPQCRACRKAAARVSNQKAKGVAA